MTNEKTVKRVGRKDDLMHVMHTRADTSHRPDDTRLPWGIVWRTASVLSIVLACLGAALFRFAHAQPSLLVIGAAVIGTWVGVHLPVRSDERSVAITADS